LVTISSGCTSAAVALTEAAISTPKTATANACKNLRRLRDRMSDEEDFDKGPEYIQATP
jgi:hypothetical protein